MSSSWKTVASFDTEYPADSVEWCPIEPFFDYFVCGTYLLLDDDKKDQENYDEKLVQERIGTLLLMRIVNKELELVQKLQTSGILDVKWSLQVIEEKILVGVVTAKGEVNIYQFHENLLKFVAGVNLRTDEEGDYMTLAINWASDTGISAKLCVSDNKGNGAVLSYCCGNLQIDEKWNAHSLEAWTIAFDVVNPNILYSGGDDAELKVWDRRSGEASQQYVCRRRMSGVTIIQPDSGKEHLLIEGNFDELLNIWDTRNFKAPALQVLCSGGPWRVKRLRNYLLTANIYGCFEIVDFSASPRVVADYKEHASLAYGADWSLLEGPQVSEMFNVGESSCLIGTCSFYDRKLTLSTWDPDLLP